MFNVMLAVLSCHSIEIIGSLPRVEILTFRGYVIRSHCSAIAFGLGPSLALGSTCAGQGEISKGWGTPNVPSFEHRLPSPFLFLCPHEMGAFRKIRGAPGAAPGRQFL